MIDQTNPKRIALTMMRVLILVALVALAIVTAYECAEAEVIPQFDEMTIDVDKKTEAKPRNEAKLQEEEPKNEFEGEPEDATIAVSYSVGVAYNDAAESAPDDDGIVNANANGNWISAASFRMSGRVYDGSGWSYTYYSEKVLPGGGLSIPGRHVDDEGYVVDGDGNLCLASDDLAYGTVVSVPFGSGTAVVYDCGSGYGNLDVYVSW